MVCRSALLFVMRLHLALFFAMFEEMEVCMHVHNMNMMPLFSDNESCSNNSTSDFLNNDPGFDGCLISGP